MKKKIAGFSVAKKFVTEGERLEGVIVEKKVIEIVGKKQEVVVIRDKDDLEWTLFISAGLRPLHDLSNGEMISIIYRGLKKLKDGKTFKLFDIYLLDSLDSESNDLPF